MNFPLTENNWKIEETIIGWSSFFVHATEIALNAALSSWDQVVFCSDRYYFKTNNKIQNVYRG